MKFYLFSCISLTLAHQGFARNIELPSTESTLNSSENTTMKNTESTLSSTASISTTTETGVKCPENMTSSPWRPVATTLECYCDYPFLPLPVNDTCFEHLKQGPCEPGNFLVQPLWKIDEDLPLPRCAPNPCVEDGLVPYDGTCRNIITQPICANGVLFFKEADSDIICLMVHRFQTLIEVPFYRKCPVDSRPDKNGICKKTL